MTKLKKIDAAIRDFYQKKTPPVSSDLISAILYSVDSGGKRIRPLIFLDLLEGFGLELTPSHYDIAASLVARALNITCSLYPSFYHE